MHPKLTDELTDHKNYLTWKNEVDVRKKLYGTKATIWTSYVTKWKKHNHGIWRLDKITQYYLLKLS